jgi:hypothetical protein
LTSLPLLKQIVKDLENVQAAENAKSFIYFTKGIHLSYLSVTWSQTGTDFVIDGRIPHLHIAQLHN